MAEVRTYPGKRLFDLVVALVLLVLLSPVLAVLWGFVRFNLGKPAFYRQRRPGLGGNPFTILKLRTMTDKRDPNGDLLPDSRRLTSLGRGLRLTSLDELPELINVVRGDMSLVGPRPLLEQYMPYFRKRERLRFCVRPGITGLAQVSGRNLLNWDERLELDAQYVESMSFTLDLRILLKTVLSVFRRHGVSADVDEVETWLDQERSAEVSVPTTGSDEAKSIGE